MTGVFKRSLSQSQILKGIQDKNTVVPKYFFLMVFRDKIMDYKGELNKILVASWQGERFDLKVVKHLDELKSLKTQSFICLC